MATWAVGDVQGCLKSLEALLEKIKFDPQRDYLWLAGDLIGRGPDPAGLIDFLISLGNRVTCVLGNHDINLLAINEGLKAARPDDNLESLLDHPKKSIYINFILNQRLIVFSKRLNVVMTHAGLYPGWSVPEAIMLGDEVSSALKGENRSEVIRHLYGDTPVNWSPELSGNMRLRFITNAFTRMRFCDTNGCLDFSHKGGLGTAPDPWHPWFELPNTNLGNTRVVFGHWSTAGLINQNNFIGLDSGCVWGGNLSAVQLEPEHANIVSVPCNELLTIPKHESLLRNRH